MVIRLGVLTLWAIGLSGLGCSAAAHAGVGVANVFDALGGLRGPLEEQGWVLATDRSSTVSPGDIYDPVDRQVQVYGRACFAQDAVRAGVAPSMEVDRALKASGRVRFGAGGVGASVNGSIDAQITSARIAEIAVVNLEPSELCARQLQNLARAGANVASWVVVQSTLTTDLEINVCGGGDVGVLAGPGGEVSVGMDSCRKTTGTSVVLAMRPEPLGMVLASARVPLPAQGAPLPAPKKRHEKPPCWLTGPCGPYVQPAFDIMVGRGVTMGAADNAARERLLEPYERQRPALQELGLGDPPELIAAGAVVVADRYRDDQAYYSLLILDRAAVQGRLDAQIALARAALAAPAPRDPVEEARSLARALPIAAELSWREAELAVLHGDDLSLASAWAERAERHKRALAALEIRPPGGAASGPVSTALERAGLRVAAGDPDLILGLALSPPASRKVQGFTNVTRTGVLELRAGDRVLGSVDVEAAASSEDASRALLDSDLALQAKVADLSVGLVQQALGLRAPEGQP